nr:hypothetical protein [Sphingobium sp.]
MAEPFDRRAIGTFHREDDLSRLPGNNPARGKARTVPRPLHHIIYLACMDAGTQEIAVERMNRAPLGGAIGRAQGLRHDLAAEQGPIGIGLVIAILEQVRRNLVHLQQGNDIPRPFLFHYALIEASHRPVPPATHLL